MDAVEFPEQNTEIAKDQPCYLTLPAHIIKNDNQGRVVFCWKLTFLERITLLFYGKIWHQVLTFNTPLQPQKLTIEKPEMP